MLEMYACICGRTLPHTSGVGRRNVSQTSSSHSKLLFSAAKQLSSQLDRGSRGDMSGKIEKTIARQQEK